MPVQPRSPRRPGANTSPAKRPDRPATRPAPGESSPPADLATIAGKIPAELLQQLASAIESGHWLFAVWHVSGGKIHLQRTATEFPTADLDQAVALLAENLQPLKGSK